ncbi:tyrosine-type recombinase/integrase [Streptomyces hygroscopicus]|uniref:tyrosine-type recombinase/integrase n=1 Tax=Streptomyces hygroscopicus TaxID=1912 RepID=UPI002AD4335C|nr:tyrosine-type recombinase/integrase [Streptomyces hygroscopicus]
MHALRHYYASVVLDAGENVRALAEYLGHADPGFTLRTYTHLHAPVDERPGSSPQGHRPGVPGATGRRSLSRPRKPEPKSRRPTLPA